MGVAPNDKIVEELPINKEARLKNDTLIHTFCNYPGCIDG